MNMPKVVTVAKDVTNKIRYEVVAYRSLNAAEMSVAIQACCARRRPNRNSVVQIITGIGARD